MRFTDEQLAERNASLNASEAAAALGLAPRRTPWDLWAEKSGRLEPFSGNAATDMGSWLEPAILNVAESELGELSRGEQLFAPGVDFPLAATLDARIKSSGVPVEAKTSGIVGPVYGEWGAEHSDEVPPVYLVQLIIQTICAESDLGHLYAILGGRGMVRYRAMRDDELSRDMVETLGRWWERHIVQDVEPTRTEPVPLEVVKRLRRTPSKTIELYAEDMATVSRYEVAKAQKSAAEKLAEATQAELLLLLGDAEAATLPDGRRLEYMKQKRKSFVVAESEFRVLRIKKG